MKALRVLVPVALLIGLYAWAGPRPKGALTVSGSGVAVVCIGLDPGWAYTLQCPNAATWYRTVNAGELADGGSGLVTAGAGMTDGGAFGVLADFRTQGDPVMVSLSTNPPGAVPQPTESGVCLLGIDAGGTWPCYFSSP